MLKLFLSNLSDYIFTCGARDTDFVCFVVELPQIAPEIVICQSDSSLTKYYPIE